MRAIAAVLVPLRKADWFSTREPTSPRGVNQEQDTGTGSESSPTDRCNQRGWVLSPCQNQFAACFNDFWTVGKTVRLQ